MKKRWQKALIWLLICALFFGEGAFNVAQADTAAAEETHDVGESGEEAYDSISLVQIESYTATKLTWSWFSDGNNDGFLIYRKCEYDEDWRLIGEVANMPYETHTFTDSAFVRGIQFAYKITAYRYNGDSEEKIEGSSVTRTVKVAIPKTKLSKAKRKGKKVKLTWKKVSGASGYEIYQKVGSGSYQKIQTIEGGTVVTKTLSNVTVKKNVRYKIRAYVTYGKNQISGKYGNVKVVLSAAEYKIAKKFKKLQKQYPSGYYWNHVGKKKYDSTTVTQKPCNHTYYDDLSTCNYYQCPNGVIGFQCYGFAWLMSDSIFGRSAKIKNFSSFKKCKAGDVIRYGGHSVIVVEKHKNYVVVGECNYGNTCRILWGRRVYKSELKTATYSRRY